MVACKSFKQLLAARDKDLMDSLTGDKDSELRHFAYVCLRSKEDVFKIVNFSEPLPEDYRPYLAPDGAGLGASLFEGEAFPYVEGMPILKVMDARETWYKDHDDFSVYQVGTWFMWSLGKAAF